MTRFLGICVVLGAVLGGVGCGGYRTRGPLRTASEVMSLSERKLADCPPVEIRGVITVIDPGWRLMTIQDSTGGLLVALPASRTSLRVGDLVEVKGVVSVDSHVRSIVGASVRVLGTAPLQPNRVTADALSCGAMSYRLVEVELRPLTAGAADMAHPTFFSSRQSCGELLVFGPRLWDFRSERLSGHRVRIQGAPLPTYAPSGKLLSVRLIFARAGDVEVLEPAAPYSPPPGWDSLPEMSSVEAIKALPLEEAVRGYPVRVEGVVIAAYSGGLTVQVGPRAIAAYFSGPSPAHPGERVRIVGWTGMGGFAPAIQTRTVELLGVAPFPKPIRVFPGDVFHGEEENRWVDIEGIVIGVFEETESVYVLELNCGAKRLQAYIVAGGTMDRLRPLVNARISARGTYRPRITAARELVRFELRVVNPDFVTVLEPPPREIDFRPIPTLTRYHPRGRPVHRIRTSGCVTYRDGYGKVYLQDGETSLRVVGNGSDDPPLNSIVTVDGFLAPGEGPPRLESVDWVEVKPGSPPSPQRPSPNVLTSGEMEGRLVEVEGFLEIMRIRFGQLQLGLASGGTRFSIYMAPPWSTRALPVLREGALLRVTGVWATPPEGDTTENRQAKLWLRQPGDVVVIGRAPWWDLQRALYAVSIAAVLLGMSLVLVIHLRRRLVLQMELRSRLEQQLMHAQKLESLGRLAGGVAHDFNNYLTVVLGYVSQLLSEFHAQSGIRQQLLTIREVAERAATLTRQLLVFSRKQVLQLESHDLNEVINGAKATLLPLIGEQIRIEVKANKVDRVKIDQTQFMQVLVNLAVNARDAMPNGGKLTFDTENVEIRPGDARLGGGLRPGRYVRLSVTDTGAGMDDATRQRIFEPFFTTKAQGKGTGLGLAMVFGIIQQTNGHIEVRSKPGEGTAFRIYLPAADSAEAARPQAKVAAQEQAGSESILIVEDQPAVRTLIRVSLQNYGYHVIEAASPQDALRLLADPSASVDLLLTDMVMPEMSGGALANEAARIRPGIPILFMSGHSEEMVGPRTEGRPSAFLQKPFTPAQVASAIRGLLSTVHK